MKKLILILMASFLFAQESPCEDETYLELKKKQLDELSEREYQYFTTKDAACEQWKLNQQDLSKTVVEAETKKAEIKNANVSNIAWAIVAAIIMIGIFFG